jgi:hypothetical protein
VPAFGQRMVCTSCGIVGADARPNWKEEPPRESLTGVQWRSKEKRRALQLLARSPDGCTEALMMAYGFPIELLGDLVMAAVALATPHDTRAGRQPMIVVWMTITEAGRLAIAD